MKQLSHTVYYLFFFFWEALSEQINILFILLQIILSFKLFVCLSNRSSFWLQNLPQTDNVFKKIFTQSEDFISSFDAFGLENEASLKKIK